MFWEGAEEKIKYVLYFSKLYNIPKILEVKASLFFLKLSPIWKHNDAFFHDDGVCMIQL